MQVVQGSSSKRWTESFHRIPLREFVFCCGHGDPLYIYTVCVHIYICKFGVLVGILCLRVYGLGSGV